MKKIFQNFATISRLNEQILKNFSLAINTLDAFTDFMNLSQFGSRIIHAIIRVLPVTELQPASINFLCSLVIQLKKQYLIFENAVDVALKHQKINPETLRRYYFLLARVKEVFKNRT